MLKQLSDYFGLSIHARDGDLGPCTDLLVDDVSWAVRYLVVKTARWLPGRTIVLPPVFFEEPDWEAKRVSVRLSKEQVEKGPPLDEHAPVSRQYEISYHEFYTLPFYWIAESRLESSPDARGVIHPVPDESREEFTAAEELAEEAHLRSVREMIGYRVLSGHDEVGHVEDFIVDDEGWSLRYLLADTGSWLPGRKVPLSTQWISTVRWTDRTVHIPLKVDLIKHSPVFDLAEGLTRSDETLLHDHYQRRYYWS